MEPNKPRTRHPTQRIRWRKEASGATRWSFFCRSLVPSLGWATCGASLISATKMEEVSGALRRKQKSSARSTAEHFSAKKQFLKPQSNFLKLSDHRGGSPSALFVDMPNWTPTSQAPSMGLTRSGVQGSFRVRQLLLLLAHSSCPR